MDFRDNSNWDQLFGFTYWKGPTVSVEDLHKLKEIIDHEHEKTYGNPRSRYFVPGVKERIESEKSYVSKRMIDLGYDIFWIPDVELPLIVDHYIEIINGYNSDIGIRMMNMLEEDAKFKGIDVDAFVDNVIDYFAPAPEIQDSNKKSKGKRKK